MTRSLSIIVPAFNEAGNLGQALKEISAAAIFCVERHEIIIVDDGSTDGTAEIADSLAEIMPAVRVIHHPKNLGLRAAYESGLAVAAMGYVVWFPSDCEMAYASIKAILTAVDTTDLVIPYHGTPERRTWIRRLLTWGSTTQLNWLLGHSLHYFQGTVVYPTELARRLPRTEAGFFVMAEQLAHALDAGLTYTEVPLEHVERTSGVSKAVSWAAIWRAQKLILRLWWRLRVQPFGDVLAYVAG